MKKENKSSHNQKTTEKKHIKLQKKDHKEIYICPNCQHEIIYETIPSDLHIITCDVCNTTAIIKPLHQYENKNGLLYKALQKNNTTSSYFCPYCQNIITLSDSPSFDFIISCPHCGESALYRHTQKNNEKEPKPLKKININQSKSYQTNNNESFDDEIINKSKTHWYHQPYLRARLIGISLIIMGGLLFVFSTDTLLIKLCIGLFLIGIISSILISEKRFIIFSENAKGSLIPQKQSNLLFSEKLTILLTILIISLFLITNTFSIEVFFILIYLGLLIIKELTDEITPRHVKLRLNMFIVGFFILFIIIIGNQIMNSILT